MKKFFYSWGAFLIFFPLTGNAQAADVAVLRQDTQTLQTVNVDENKIIQKKALTPIQASILASSIIGTNQGLGTDTGSLEERFWVGDFLATSDGFEELVINGTNGLEIISSADGSVLDSFRVTNKNDDIAMTVGDLYPDVAGQEVVVCHRNATPSRLRIFSYNEDTGTATKELSFQPFSDLNRSSGCSDLQIADIDSDGTAEVVAMTENSLGSTVRVFSPTGDVERTIDFGFPDDWGLIHFDLLDFDGDGVKDEVAIPSAGIIYIKEIDGTPITYVDMSSELFPSYNIGNIDDDTADEIVILSGKKSKVTILENTGARVTGLLFPKSPRYKFRSILIGDLSSFME